MSSGRVYQPRLAIACGVSDFGTAVADLDLSAFKGADAAKRGAWLKEAREAWIKFTTPPQAASPHPSRRLRQYVHRGGLAE
jgi:hypothetical protein